MNCKIQSLRKPDDPSSSSISTPQARPIQAKPFRIKEPLPMPPGNTPGPYGKNRIFRPKNQPIARFFDPPIPICPDIIQVPTVYHSESTHHHKLANTRDSITYNVDNVWTWWADVVIWRRSNFQSLGSGSSNPSGVV